jgi:hypothetical protein
MSRRQTYRERDSARAAEIEAVRALLAACQLMIDGDWITACAAARAAIAQAEAAGIKVMT